TICMTPKPPYPSRGHTGRTPPHKVRQQPSAAQRRPCPRRQSRAPPPGSRRGARGADASVASRPSTREWKTRALVAVVLLGAVGVLLVHGGMRGPRSPRFVVDGVVIDPNATVQPRKAYRLHVWETATLWPSRPGQFEEDFRAALLLFADRYPQVDVEVTFIPEHEMVGRLEEAITSGSPPDVAA